MDSHCFDLQIGIAVGDIDKIQRSAYLKRIALQVELMFSFENNMPRWLQRKAYVRQAVIKPNREKFSQWNRVSQNVHISSVWCKFIPEPSSNSIHYEFKEMNGKMN